MSGFTFVCPHARPDENGAHDITDVMRNEYETTTDQVKFYCRRCGQVAEWADQAAEQARDQDKP